MARFEVIPKRYWKNNKTGATASLYDAVPYQDAEQEKEWGIVESGFSIRDNDENRIFGNNYPPYVYTKAEAETVADKLNKRMQR